jgi:chromosome segregation ATPase
MKQIEALAKIAELEKQLADIASMKDETITSLQNAHADVEALTAQRDELLKGLTELTEKNRATEKALADAQARITELEAGAKSAEIVGAEIAVEAMAAVGQEPVAQAPDTASAENVLEQYSKLSGREATEFFAKNKGAILRLLAKK